MIRTTVLVIVICALLVGIISATNADDAWANWKDQSTKQYMQIAEVVNPMPSLESYVWQSGDSFDSPGLLLDDTTNDYHAANYPQRLRIVGGGSGSWQQADPSIPIYVRLVTKLKNTGTEDWTDFHLRAISGCYIYPKYVMDNGLWSRYWDYTGDSNGWDYIMDSTYDPFWGSEYGQVHTNEYFSCETWIAVTSPTGDFEVELWPTAVPEPGAFVTLASGLIALGAGMRRRKIS